MVVVGRGYFSKREDDEFEMQDDRPTLPLPGDKLWIFLVLFDWSFKVFCVFKP